MTRAALILIFGMALVPLGDSAGKLLVGRHDVAPVFVAWSRFVLGALMLLPFLSRRHLSRAAATDWRVYLRAGLIVAGILSILTALQTAPLADAYGAFFVGPLVSYLLSVAFLGERVGILRSLLVVAGFAGVLLVVRPGFGMAPGVGFAILAGVCYGGYLTASRWLSDVALPRTLLMSQLLLGAVVAAPFALADLPALTAPVSALIVTSAACSAAANLLLVVAYRMAPATRLAPLIYFQLVAASVYGLAIFGDVPDAPVWAGLALLVASGLASLALRRD